MNFFCTKKELDQYAEGMELDMKTVIKADLTMAVEEAKATFLVVHRDE